MGRQTRPRGVLVPITEEWVDRVEAALIAKKMDRKDLAAGIGVSPPAITQTLNRISKSSRLVVPISEFLEVHLPHIEIRELQDIVWHGIGRTLRELDRVQYDQQVAELEALIAKITRRPRKV